MGEVVALDDFRPSEEVSAAVDRAIIDQLLSNDCAASANEACGFMSMRIYQMGVKTTDINATMDLDIIRFLTAGLLERTKGMVTDNTLLLDTLRLHFQLDEPVGLVGTIVNEDG